MHPTTDPKRFVVNLNDNPVDVMLEMMRRQGFEPDPAKADEIRRMREYCEQRI